MATAARTVNGARGSGQWPSGRVQRDSDDACGLPIRRVPVVVTTTAPAVPDPDTVAEVIDPNVPDAEPLVAAAGARARAPGVYDAFPARCAAPTLDPPDEGPGDPLDPTHVPRWGTPHGGDRTAAAAAGHGCRPAAAKTKPGAVS